MQGTTFGVRALLLILLFTPGIALAVPSTPEVGSPERKAICDLARETERNNISVPAFLWKVRLLRTENGYGYFEGVAVNPDGSFIPADKGGDDVYALVLKGQGTKWSVIVDLTRGDAPSAAEAERLAQQIPADFPYTDLFPKDWQAILKR